MKIARNRADLLSYGFLVLFFGVTAIIWLTSVSDRANNQVHNVVPFWPPVGLQTEKIEVQTIKTTDYPTLTSKRIHIGTTAQDTVILDSDTPQHLSIKQTYTKSADFLHVTSTLTGSDLLVEVAPDERTIDLPLVAVPTGNYEFTLGGLGIPTYLDYDGLASKTVIDLKNSPLQTLDLSLDTGQIDVFLTEKSLPTDGVLLETDKGDVVFNLPRMGVELAFKIKHDGTITIADQKYKDQVLELNQVMFPIPGTPNLKMNITTYDGDVEIKNTGVRPQIKVEE